MTYQFNPHNHVKIWLSKDQNSFLNPKNQLRLIRMRAKNPKDAIYFVYDSQLLNHRAFDALTNFCDKLNIRAVDIRATIFPDISLTTDVKQLLECYQSEIDALKNGGGSLEACRNILCWLPQLYSLGTYSNFNVEIDTTGLTNKTISVDAPILMNLGTTAPPSLECLTLNKDLIAVIGDDDKATQNKISKIHTAILKAYSPNAQTNSAFLKQRRDELTKKTNCEEAAINKLLPDDKQRIQLDKLGENKTPSQVRAYFIDNKALSNVMFCKEMYPETINMNDDHTIRYSASKLREKVKNSLVANPKQKTINRDYSPLLTIEDSGAFIKKLREVHCKQMLSKSIMSTTGAECILSTFDDLFFTNKNEAKHKVSPYSFEHYGLTKAFMSKNPMKLRAVSSGAIKKQSSAINEKTLLAEKTSLPQQFTTLKKEITQHIKKINRDLKFGFWFHHKTRRTEKINALTTILKNFDNQENFDATTFLNNLNDYKTAGINAARGKSQTKALIDKLEILSIKSRWFSLLDEEKNILTAEDNSLSSYEG